ncbi:replication factor C large subunit [archaeon]|nr:replication factor C large subunit [archaeon]
MIPWTKKYLPKNIPEIIGQKVQIQKIKTNLAPKRPIILYGPIGTGKTSIVYALAKERNLEVLEINASDVRNKGAINKIVGSSIQQQSLFHKGKIILIDDVDALSGTKDRGCIQELTKLLPKSKFPMILTCIDPYHKKLKTIRRKTTLIELDPISLTDTKDHLTNLAQKENIKFNEQDIISIAEKAKGDLRVAINDLQTNIIDNNLNLNIPSERDSRESILYCLSMIFKSKNINKTNNIFNKAGEDLDTCILWLDENLPKEYSSEELKKAYNYLSRADVFKGRIRRWQYWRYLVYINTLITSGIAISKEKKQRPVTTYKQTTRILKLWQAKMRNAKRTSISDKLAKLTHTSVKRAVQDTFPYLKQLLTQEDICKELNLSEDEVAWLQR